MSFNSRTLGRVRLSTRSIRAAFAIVSIHAPWEGCDQVEDRGLGILGGFNSRTLGRVRLKATVYCIHNDTVSIHAPWEGCDARRVRRKSFSIAFQFTHPGKGATKRSTPIVGACEFQFTHPGKGATSLGTHLIRSQSTFQFTHPGKGATKRQSTDSRRLRVSIHAPWEGCDLSEDS